MDSPAALPAGRGGVLSILARREVDNSKGMRNRNPDIPGETWNFLGDT